MREMIKPILITFILAIVIVLVGLAYLDLQKRREYANNPATMQWRLDDLETRQANIQVCYELFKTEENRQECLIINGIITRTPE